MIVRFGHKNQPENIGGGASCGCPNARQSRQPNYNGCAGQGRPRPSSEQIPSIGTIVRRIPSTVIVGILCLLCACQARSASAQLAATVRLGTGEVRLTNVGAADYDLVAYSVFDPAELLIVENWRYISGRTDNSASGDGSFDPSGVWSIISPQPLVTPSTTDELVEGTLGAGGILMPGDRLYLGAIWDIENGGFLSVQSTTATTVLNDMTVTYLPPGDFNEDAVVDTLDYILWRSNFGNTGEGLLADGNADQVVDLIDYTLWRDHLGATGTSISPIAFATASATVAMIPEPTAVTLAALLIAGLSVVRKFAR